MVITYTIKNQEYTITLLPDMTYEDWLKMIPKWAVIIKDKIIWKKKKNI